MKTLNSYYKSLEKKFRRDDRSLVGLALLLELLVVSYIAFLALFTLEMLLPGFVSSRISLVKFFGFLLLFSIVAIGVARLLEVRFSPIPPLRRPFLILTGLWLTGILSLAFMKFPLWAAPLLVIGALAIFFLFVRLFFQSVEKS